ncbi:UNVERIFIED_ORG: hypothetical protein FHR35_005646 [Microbispora rosea subsp. rosea]
MMIAVHDVPVTVTPAGAGSLDETARRARAARRRRYLPLVVRTPEGRQ